MLGTLMEIKIFARQKSVIESDQSSYVLLRITSPIDKINCWSNFGVVDYALINSLVVFRSYNRMNGCVHMRIFS